MIKFEGEKVIEIDREAEEVAIPPTATRICEVACFFGSITSLDLENTQITIIENHAFANCYNLKEVKFPSCLEEICEGAFKDCANLIHISFPPDSKLLKIGSSAFKRCSKLKKFDPPLLLEFIGDNSFDNCIELKCLDLRKTKVRDITLIILLEQMSIYLPKNVALNEILEIDKINISEYGIDESLVYYQKNLDSYNFSNGTISRGNKKLRHVLIRNSVEMIAKLCFYKSNLVCVTIPSSVIEISRSAFYCNKSLQKIRFSKDSRLRVIGKRAFSYCSSIKKIQLPKSLKIIKEVAFGFCKSLELVVFPLDSQLERIDCPFIGTTIKHLSLPPSVREIVDICFGMNELESIFVSNDIYKSNEEGSAIFSKDGSELVCVIRTLKQFEIPDCVRVIKKRAFDYSSITSLGIPPSVEIIEEEAFNGCYLIEFQSGSRLKSLAFDAFDELEDLIINNENFIKMENGVVMSLNPRGIVFVPKELTEFDIPPGVEVIYSNAFYESNIKGLKLPKSLKKIYHESFNSSSFESLTFEEGTELDFIGNYTFDLTHIKTLKLPFIKGSQDNCSLYFGADVIEFPPNFQVISREVCINSKKVVCPYSSLKAIAHFNYCSDELPIFEFKNK